MRDTLHDGNQAVVEDEDNVIIVCLWPHAVFLWTQALPKRRLHYDREYGDLAALRDALA